MSCFRVIGFLKSTTENACTKALLLLLRPYSWTGEIYSSRVNLTETTDQPKHTPAILQVWREFFRKNWSLPETVYYESARFDTDRRKKELKSCKIHATQPIHSSKRIVVQENRSNWPFSVSCRVNVVCTVISTIYSVLTPEKLSVSVVCLGVSWSLWSQGQVIMDETTGPCKIHVFIQLLLSRLPLFLIDLRDKQDGLSPTSKTTLLQIHFSDLI